MRSTTSTSTGARSETSLSPRCSSGAVKIEGGPGIEGTGAPFGVNSGSGVQVSQLFSLSLGAETRIAKDDPGIRILRVVSLNCLQ
jgi:hypothetical protein